MRELNARDKKGNKKDSPPPPAPPCHLLLGHFSASQKETMKQIFHFLGRTHSQMLGKVESGGGPIFKVVLEC